MEKILIALDNINMNESAVRFACYLAKQTDSILTAVFLDPLEIREEITCKQTANSTYFESHTVLANEDEISVAKRHDNITLFKKWAEEESAQVFIHTDKGIPFDEIIAESRFADALIVDAAFSVQGADENQPTDFVKDILHDAQCPVIVCHEPPEWIDNIIFCYDGSKSSIFAMKQFAHLLPELKSKRIKIIYLNAEEEMTKDDEDKITEWLMHHYTNDIEWLTLQDDSRTAFFDYLIKKKNDFVVMGSYGKGLLLSFFEKEKGTATLGLPIFVSHL